MPDNVLSVSIGELVVSNNQDDVLVAYGLGSCVAVCMYDPTAKVAGMIHSLLPKSAKNNGFEKQTAKFVDQGVPLLVDSILKAGAQRQRLNVYLAGGAQMLSAPGFSNSLNIGARNISTAEEILRATGFRILAQSTGGNSGRTVKLFVGSGKITVKTLGQGEVTLSPELSFSKV
ncbi:MAG: chemotaxis protein CheD [Chloroflexi bacterium]|nr:MAG: chemotaxis protein CheD [Chloroflexota bacterium]